MTRRALSVRCGQARLWRPVTLEVLSGGGGGEAAAAACSLAAMALEEGPEEEGKSAGCDAAMAAADGGAEHDSDSWAERETAAQGKSEFQLGELSPEVEAQVGAPALCST